MIGTKEFLKAVNELLQLNMEDAVIRLSNGLDLKYDPATKRFTIEK